MAFHPRNVEWPTESGTFPAQPMESGDDFSHVTYRTPFSDGKQTYSPPGWGHVSWSFNNSLKRYASWPNILEKGAIGGSPNGLLFWRYLLIYPLHHAPLWAGEPKWVEAGRGGRGGGGGERIGGGLFFNENYIQLSIFYLWSYYYYLIKFYIIKN
jgi:hypothetical protein